jgi:acyl phosphate:glycerol-3-phosphate acyltransferase
MSEIGMILAGYLIGSIPFGLLISKMIRGVDPRREGSGNIGATNVLRVVGQKRSRLDLGL